jgi:hypothetical protein
MEVEMARDKAKDDLLFNCSQDHELNYVSGLYAEKTKVKQFLIDNCKNGVIKNYTHKQVYELIQKKLGYSIPV